MPPHQYGCIGLFTRQKPTNSGFPEFFEPKPLPLQSISADITIRGFVSHAKVDLEYKNDSQNPLEVTFKCPVDFKSAIYKFEAQLDGRTIQSHCLERKKAEKKYEEAISSGHTAILGEENEMTSDLFHMTLGNLPPDESCKLCLSFVSELPIESDGAISFTLPTVFNPRYSPSNSHCPKPAFYATYDHMVVTTSSEYTMCLKAQVTGTNKINKIISSTDAINVQMDKDEDKDTSAKVTLDSGFKRDHDFSFRVYYRDIHQPHYVRERGDRSATSFMKSDVIMLNFFPEIPAEAYSPHNEIIFLVDRSGSMRGECIEYAKSTLLLFLKSLPVGCRFNIVSFGTFYEKLFNSSSERYTRETLELALKLQRSMQADFGGTEIYKALQGIFTLEPTKGYARKVLLLTDGEVWNVDQVIALVANNKNENNVFSIGVGSGASTALVKGIAKAGGGRSEMILKPDQMQEKVMGLLTNMLQENVVDVKIDCGIEGDDTFEAPIRLIPKIPPVIFGGQHLILYAKIDRDVQMKSISLKGVVRGLPVEYKVSSNFEKVVHDESLSLHRLTAKAQIIQWQMEDPEDYQEKIVSLSELTGVVSKYTALLGIDKDSKVIVKKQERPNFALPTGNLFGQPVALSCQEMFSPTPSNQFSSGRQRGGSLFGSSSPSFGNAGSLQNSSAPVSFHHSLRGGGPPPPPPNQATQFLRSPQSINCAFGSSGNAGGDPMKRSLFQSKPMGISTKKVKVSPGFSFLATTQLQSRSWLRAVPKGLDCDDDDDMLDVSASEADLLSEDVLDEGLQIDPILEIAEGQEFDGSWSLDSAKKILKLRSEILGAIQELQIQSSLDDTVLATILIISHLNLKLLDRRNEWKMLVEKAKLYLSAVSIDLEDLINRVTKVLKA